jgi:hypothetical protein
MAAESPRWRRRHERGRRRNHGLHGISRMPRIKSAHHADILKDSKTDFTEVVSGKSVPIRGSLHFAFTAHEILSAHSRERVAMVARTSAKVRQNIAESSLGK